MNFIICELYLNKAVNKNFRNHVCNRKKKSHLNIPQGKNNGALVSKEIKIVSYVVWIQDKDDFNKLSKPIKDILHVGILPK